MTKKKKKNKKNKKEYLSSSDLFAKQKSTDTVRRVIGNIARSMGHSRAPVKRKPARIHRQSELRNVLFNANASNDSIVAPFDAKNVRQSIKYNADEHKGLCVDIESVPEWYRPYAGVLAGYRCEYSLSKALISIFSFKHNEFVTF